MSKNFMNFVHKSAKKTWKIREMKYILSKCRLEGRIQNAGNLLVLAVDRKENHYVLNMDP